MINKRLVLFDIDGVLIRHVGKQYQFGDRVVLAVKKVFGIKPDYKPERYDGMMERQIVWDLVRRSGIKRTEFLKKYPDFLRETLIILNKAALKEKIYEAIPEASRLALKLKSSGAYLGLISGNSQAVARWKLNNVGIGNIFGFGLFGDEADSRLKLAGMVFSRAKKHFGIEFSPKEIVVIGDTNHDVKAGKFIGAKTIAVASGKHYTIDQLKELNPDVIVKTLSEPIVEELFLKNI